MAVAPARLVAFGVVTRVFTQGAYADRALNAEAVELDPRDRRLAMALAYTTVQRARTLDHVIDALSSRPAGALDPPVRDALRLGLAQILLMGGIADHAAVNDSVELAKRGGRGGAQLVNAVLRRAIREGPDLLAALRDDTPADAAVLHSVPDWVAELWFEELGASEARALLATINTPPESAIRVNTLRAGVLEVLARLPVPAVPAPTLPEGLILQGPFDAHGSELFAQGAIMPQSRGSMTVARAALAAPGQRLLDLCAAPGAKTTHLAALVGNDSSEFLAVEAHPGRARALERTCRRMGADSVTVHRGDGREPLGAGPFDRVLVDPPCSGLGTLQSRPDLRWQQRRAGLSELCRMQAQLLEAAALATAPGGQLVYSVCTISRAESEGVVQPFLASHPEFTLALERQLLPHRDGTDGFYIARLSRA